MLQHEIRELAQDATKANLDSIERKGQHDEHVHKNAALILQRWQLFVSQAMLCLADGEFLDTAFVPCEALGS